MSNVSISGANNNSIIKKVVIASGIGATVGAAFYGGLAYYAQNKILQKPDEFIRTFKGSLAEKNTITAFIKSGKIDYKAILGRAGKGALIAGAAWGTVYGIVKLISRAIKNKDSVVPELNTDKI